MTYVVDFYIATSYILVLQSKLTHIIILFTYCMIDIVSYRYPIISQESVSQLQLSSKFLTNDL